MPGRAVIFSHQLVGLSLARHALLNEAISSWRLLLARVARFTSCHSHSLTALALVRPPVPLVRSPTSDLLPGDRLRGGATQIGDKVARFFI